MQTKCALSFLKPLREPQVRASKTSKLISKENMRKILYDAMEILTKEANFIFDEVSFERAQYS